MFWSLFIGIGAYAGAAMMFISPDGSMFGMEPLLPLIRELPLPDLFFRDFIWSGIALLVVNGLTNTAAFILLKRENRYGSIAGAVCGIILVLWTALQLLYLFGFNFMSFIFFLFGLAQLANGLYLRSLEKKQSA